MHRYRVLVVEDDAGSKFALANILKLSGVIDGIIEENGEAVLDLVRAGIVDLVLMDISLANTYLDGQPVDGLELTRRIKKLAVPADHVLPPVVLLTAHCMKGDAERFLDACGADAYIAKPLHDLDGFIVWLSLTIEEYRARMGAAETAGAA